MKALPDNYKEFYNSLSEEHKKLYESPEDLEEFYNNLSEDDKTLFDLCDSISQDPSQYLKLRRIN